jgi:Dolichyl-phosphate-mannose-protein mannosyltransferase
MARQVIRLPALALRLAVGGGVLLFLLIAGWNVVEPGLYYDELLFVDAALGQPNNIFRHINFGPLPVMLMSYIGALKAWLYYPIFKLFGVTAYSVRWPMVLVGALTLWLNYRVLLKGFSRPVALVFLAMAAVEPATLFHTRLDWGPTALMMLFRSLMLLGTVQWLITREPKYLVALLLAAVLGVFDKLNFLWLCVALAASLLLVYPRFLLDFCRQRPRFCAITAVVLAVIGLGIFSYMRSQVPLEAEIGQDDWHYRLLIVRNLLASTLSGSGVYAIVTLDPALVAFGMLQLQALGIALLAAVAVSLPLRHRINWRMTVFFLVFILSLLVALFFTKQATGPHHTATLAPLWLLLLAPLLGQPFASGSDAPRWTQLVAGTAVLLVCAASLRVDFLNLQGFQSQPSARWDRGSEALVAAIKRYPGRVVITADWGTGTIINGLTNGEVTVFDNWSGFVTYPDATTIDNYEALIADRSPLFVLPAAGTATFPEARSNIMTLAQARNWQSTLEATINGHDGQPLFLLYSVELPASIP